MAISIPQLNAVTRNHYIPVLVDNIFKSNVLTYKMLRNSKPVSGGYRVRQPIEYDKLDDVGGTASSSFYAGTDAMTYGHKDFITAAEYEWVQAYSTAQITGLEEHTNDGPEKVVDLLESKMKNVERSMRDLFADGLYGDQGDTSSSQKRFPGLKHITKTGTSSNVLGGIDPTDVATWQGGFDKAVMDSGDADPSFSDLTDSTDSAYIQNNFREAYGKVTIGTDVPNLIICSQVVYDAYEQTLTDQKRFGASSKSLADAGFQNLLYRGTPVVIDQALESAGEGNVCYFLNTKYIGFKHHRKRNFVWEDWIKPIDKDLAVGKLLWMGALCVSSRRMHSRIRNLPTAY